MADMTKYKVADQMGMQFLRALGIDPDETIVSSIKLTLKAGDIARVEVKTLVRPSQLETIIRVFKAVNWKEKGASE